MVEHRRAPFGVGMGRHQPARLMIEKKPRAFARRQWLAVHRDDVVFGDVERGRIDDAAVDRHASLYDPFLGVAARGKARARDDLGDALAGFLDLWRTRRTPLLKTALTIGATAAKGRAFSKDLALVLIVPAGPVEFRTVAPRRTEFRTLAKRTIALGTILTRPLKPRAFVAIAMARFIVAGTVESRSIGVARIVTGGARIAPATIGHRGLTFFPWLQIAAVSTEFPIATWTAAEILKRTAIARKFPVAAEFPAGRIGKRPIATGTLAILRSRLERTVAAWPVSVLAKTLMARRKGPLLAILPRGIGFLVAEFPVLEA